MFRQKVIFRDIVKIMLYTLLLYCYIHYNARSIASLVSPKFLLFGSFGNVTAHLEFSECFLELMLMYQSRESVSQAFRLPQREACDFLHKNDLAYFKTAI